MSSYVITGAARGLGFGWVSALSEDPSNHVFGMVRNASAASALSKLASEKKNVHIVEADVTNLEQLKLAVEKIAKVTGGALDVLINNAGFVDNEVGHMNLTDFEGKEELLKQSLNRSLEINVLGVIYTTNAFLPLIKKGHSKKIVNISTGLADPELSEKIELSGAIPYTTTKAVLNFITAKYAIQFKSEGVIFVAMSPGWVNTRDHEPSDQEKAQDQYLVSIFRKAVPDLQGMITIEDSIRMQGEVIDNLTIKETGKFVSHHGNRHWF